jgi:hypothetical protein
MFVHAIAGSKNLMRLRCHLHLSWTVPQKLVNSSPDRVDKLIEELAMG